MSNLTQRGGGLMKSVLLAIVLVAVSFVVPANADAGGGFFLSIGNNRAAVRDARAQRALAIERAQLRRELALANARANARAAARLNAGYNLQLQRALQRSNAGFGCARGF